MAKNKVANVEVVEAPTSDSIFEGIVAQLPDLSEKKAALDEHLASEPDYKVAKNIISTFTSQGFDPVALLNAQVDANKSVDDVNLAKQKLELISRYNKWLARKEELTNAINSSFTTLDEVIAKLKELRGIKPKSSNGGGSGGSGSIACTVTNVETESVLSFSSLNKAVDELIPKEKRSPVWVKGEEGDVVDEKGFKLDEEGKRIHELDSKGNPKYYSLSATNAKAALKANGFVVNE